MPEIQNVDMYNAIQAACEQILTRDVMESLMIDIPAGTSTYRYVSYRNNAPQIGENGLKVWGDIGTADLKNRWTGSDLQGGGQRGVYLSAEIPDAGTTTFTELEHYITQNPTPQDISYYTYKPGTEPVLHNSTELNLNTMFLFNFNQAQRGVDVRINGQSRDVLQRVLDRAVETNPELFVGRDLDSLYKDPEDSSFCRAIGNHILENSQADFFCATSARGTQPADNYIMRANASSQALTSLDTNGRISWYYDPATPNNPAVPVYTMEDLAYNTTVDIPKLSPIIQEDPVVKATEKYKDIAKDKAKSISWDYIQTQIDSLIRTSVQQNIDALTDPFAVDVDVLTSQLNTDKFNDDIWSKMQDSVWSQLISDDSFVNSEIISQLGEEGAKSIVSLVVVEPKFTQISSAKSGASYISASIKGTILEAHEHNRIQNADKIQQEIVKASAEVTKTNNEIETQNIDLQIILEKIQSDPQNPELIGQRDKLKKQIDDLVAEQKELIAEQDKAQREIEDKSEEKERTEEEKKEKGKEIFEDGVRI